MGFKKTFSKRIYSVLVVVLMLATAINSDWAVMKVSAKELSTNIPGLVYEFDEDTAYTFSNATSTSSQGTYGKLTVNGQMSNTSEKLGITELCFTGDSQKKECLTISYTYDDALLNANEDEWHLIDDKSKKVDIYTLEDKILKGSIMLQTSKDGAIWVEDYAATNIFASNPNGINNFYDTTSVQLTNGCYYRVIVSYEVQKKVDPKKVLFVNVKQEETKRYCEVYKFYAYDRSAKKASSDENVKKYKLGKVERTEKFEGYAGTKDINTKDPHYGWELGKFYVSGYTDTDTSKNEVDNVVFLKAVGDRVTLGFNLAYDINCIKGNEALSIIPDTSNTDQYFGTPRMNFGRGALVVRKINDENDSDDAVVYTNFLQANATVGADTKIDLFEEGDYEVALDYKLQNDKRKIFGVSVLPEEANYRIFFNFSVRNANCMVYPFDVKTGGELSNSSLTENGFYLDLAKSKYLKVIVKKEVLKDGFDGLAEDTRFNSSAKAGDKFTDEGIYTITVTNPYTKQTTVKKICVGKNNVLKAYMVTGLSISEIQDKIANGSTIEKDGTITDPEPVVLECICEKKCSIDGINGNCEACLADYLVCIGMEHIAEVDESSNAEEDEKDTKNEEVVQDTKVEEASLEENANSDVTAEEIVQDEKDAFTEDVVVDETVSEESKHGSVIPFVVLGLGVSACAVAYAYQKKNPKSGKKEEGSEE